MKKGAITIVSILGIATCVSAYFISSTYAKYTSEFRGSDTARVAEWKLNYTNEADLFATIYDTEGETLINPGNGPVNHKEETDIKKAAENETAIIAPGAYGEYKFTLSGTAETSYKIQFDFTGSEDNTGGRITYYLNGIPCGNSIEALTKQINANFENKIFKPGDLPGNYFDTGDNTEHNEPLVETINVVWDYGNTEDTDSIDTALGIRAAQGEEIIVKLVAKIIITQVD